MQSDMAGKAGKIPCTALVSEMPRVSIVKLAKSN